MTVHVSWCISFASPLCRLGVGGTSHLVVLSRDASPACVVVYLSVFSRMVVASVSMVYRSMMAVVVITIAAV